MGAATCLHADNATRSMSVSLRTADVGPQHRMSSDQQHCTHSCRGRCQALQSSSSAPPFESPARLSRREGGAGHSRNFALRVAEIRATFPPGTPVEIWFQDEMRVAQKNKLTYRWARKGSRPRAVHDQLTQSTYPFAAVFPQSSTLKKTSGSSCGRTGCQTASSNPSTTSSAIAATPETRSSISPGKSCPSLAVIGQSPVTYCEDWYKRADGAAKYQGKSSIKNGNGEHIARRRRRRGRSRALRN